VTVPRAVRRALFLTAVVSVQRVGVVNAVRGEDPQKPETPKSQGKLALALPDDFPDTCRMQKITPFLWFDKQAEEAARFYVSIFKNSKIVDVTRYGGAGPGPQGSVMTVTFELGGQEFIALNGGPHFKFTEAISFSVNCKTQEEVDEFWRKLSDGGEEGQCGWLKDKYGLSWQINPTILGEMLSDPDPAKSKRVMEAMLKMKKIDIGRLKQAYDQR
jgi:predicted 3-demethylubiquinone-9 3-methyltransferase (glyoxalase superfamily)